MAFTKSRPTLRNVRQPLLSRRTLIAAAGLLLICLVALLLRLSYGCHLCNPDSFAYINGAQRAVEEGTLRYLATLGNIYENRISIVLPLAAFFKVLGYSQATFSAMPLAFSVGTVASAFLLGAYLEDRRTGLIAALLAAAMPIDAFYGSAVLPDTVIPFYAVLALLTYLAGCRRHNTLAFALSGFFVFCAFQARATSIVLLVVCLVFAVLTKSRDRRALLVAPVVFVLCNLLLWVLIALAGGSFFLQFEHWLSDATNANYMGTGQFFGHLRTVMRPTSLFGLAYWLAFPCWFVLAKLARNKPVYRLPLFAFALIYLFFEFGSTTLTRYEPIWKIDRFLTILTVPAALTVALVVVWTFERNNRSLRLVIFAVMSTVVLFSMGRILYASTTEGDWQDHVYALTFDEMARFPNINRIGVVNFRWSLRGQVYGMLNGRRYEFLDLINRDLEDLEDGMVVIYDPIFFSANGERHSAPESYPLAEELSNVSPQHWQKLFTVPRESFEEYPVVVYRFSGKEGLSGSGPVPKIQ